MYSSLTNLGNLGKCLKDTLISANYGGYNDDKVMWLIINSTFIDKKLKLPVLSVSSTYFI